MSLNFIARKKRFNPEIRSIRTANYTILLSTSEINRCFATDSSLETSIAVVS
jgi:hypothetical protein